MSHPDRGDGRDLFFDLSSSYDIAIPGDLKSRNAMVQSADGGGLSASISAIGKLALRQYQPFETQTTGSATQASPATDPSRNPAAAQPAPNPASATSNPKTQAEFFYSYAHDDELLRDELEMHLALLKRQGYCDCWHDRRIVAGQDWAGEISEHLESAEVILLPISSSFIASDYC